MMYDGFMSYSHAADGLLAPRLQSALQRFAKPWWKRRAVRIFRDESSLSANPHLWSSITDALDTSGWFILLLSPDAASSEWVDQEIDYWVTNRDPGRILPVVTDGTFGWTHGDVDGDAVPPALRGVFAEEPRWVDVRWARDEDQLDLKDPRFADAVADIASAVRGIPKDDLASEEVRQHRRTTRTAWAAGMLVTILAIAAIGFAVQSSRSASLAQARELAASAVGVLDTDPVLSKLLSLEAIATAPPGADQPVEVVNSLWQAAATDRLEATIDTGFEGNAKIDLSEDGELLVVTSSVEDVVRLYDTQTLGLLWEWRLANDVARSEDNVWSSTISSEGSMVAIAVMDTSADFVVHREGDVEDPRPNRIAVLDARDGSEVATIEFEDCAGVNIGIWSLDDSRLAVSSGFQPCVRDEAPSGYWIEVFETDTWESEAVLDLPLRVPRFGPVPEFDSEGRMHVFGPRTIEIYGPDYDFLREIEGSFGVAGDVTNDGSKVVSSDPESLRTSLYAADTGDRLTYLTPYRFPQIPAGVRFSSDDQFVIYGNDSAQTLVWEVASAELVYQLPSGTAEWTHLDEATMRAYTGHDGGMVKIWDLEPPSVGRTPVGDLGSATWVDANSFALGPDLGAFVAADITGGSSYVYFFDLSSGALIDVPGHPEIPSHDPERLTESDRIVPMLDGRFIYNDAGRWMARDPLTRDEEFIAGCQSDDVEVCNDTGAPLHVMAASVDGNSIVARPGGDGDWLFFDGRTGELTGSEDVEAPPGILTFTDEWFFGLNDSQIYALDRATGELLFDYSTVFTLNGAVSSSGQVAVVGDQDEIVIVDTETWTARRTDFGLGEIRGIAISPDDSLVAVGDTDALHIFDLQTTEVVQSVGVGRVSDAHWLEEDRLLIGTADGSWATVSLDVADLIDEVQRSLLRGFSEHECEAYHIEPCPTLEQMQSR